MDATTGDGGGLDSINDHVRKYLGPAAGNGWTIGCGGGGGGGDDGWPPVVAGRGVVATRDHDAGEVIFVDVPLFVSPRPVVQRHHPQPGPADRSTPGTRPPGPAAAAGCPAGCRLSVCGQRCADGPGHRDECRYVRRLQGPPGRGPGDDGRWSTGVYNAIAPVRGLLALKDGPFRCFLDVLQKKATDKPVFEVEELKRNISAKLDEEDEQIMINICKIMDANCFETITTHHNNLVSLKGLYPVASFMNHSCIPNTMHNFNEKLHMIVKASLPIRKGQEITTSYTHLIWPTTLRQNHLFTSKQFICNCNRCCDPEEFGTELSALNCIVKNCDGRIFPINPLNNTSIWHCKICTKLITSFEVTSLYKDIESLMNSINAFCPKTLDTILKTFNLNKNSPFVVDLRLKFIWKSKNNSLNLEELLYKEKSCIDMVNLVQKLGLGQCRLLGLISLELLKVIKEKVDRFRWNTKTLNLFKKQMIDLKIVSSKVLDGDANIANKH